MLETEAVHCPHWTEWTKCSQTCSWVANRDKYEHVSSAKHPFGSHRRGDIAYPDSGDSKWQIDRPNNLIKGNTRSSAAEKLEYYERPPRDQFTELPGSDNEETGGKKWRTLGNPDADDPEGKIFPLEFQDRVQKNYIHF